MAPSYHLFLNPSYLCDYITHPWSLLPHSSLPPHHYSTLPNQPPNHISSSQTASPFAVPNLFPSILFKPFLLSPMKPKPQFTIPPLLQKPQCRPIICKKISRFSNPSSRFFFWDSLSLFLALPLKLLLFPLKKCPTKLTWNPSWYPSITFSTGTLSLLPQSLSFGLS